MPAKITTLIPRLLSEAVRDRIGEILAEEMAAQFAIHAEAAWNPTVWVEREIAFDKTEIASINVMYAQTDYSNIDQLQSDGESVYDVYVIANAKSSDEKRGDKLARVNATRMAGMVRTILQSGVYRTLGFAPPSISRVTVTGIQMMDAAGAQDSFSTAAAKVSVTVRAAEWLATGDTLPINAIPNATRVKMGLTDKGYYYRISAQAIYLLDSDRLPATAIQVAALELNGVQYVLNETLDDIVALVEYLNTDFKVKYPAVGGSFTRRNNGILYFGDGAETGEIMAILRATSKAVTVVAGATQITRTGDLVAAEILEIKNPNTLMRKSDMLASGYDPAVDHGWVDVDSSGLPVANTAPIVFTTPSPGGVYRILYNQPIPTA